MSVTQNSFDVLVKLWQETAIDDNEYQYANTYFIFSQGCTDTESIIEMLRGIIVLEFFKISFISFKMYIKKKS